MDFGSGRVLDPERLQALDITQMGLTRSQSMSGDSGVGTPLYLAPEVLAGQSPSIKSDLYALGVVTFQLLVGDFRRQLSPGWEAAIDDALLRRDIADFAAGDPGKRPASARELAVRLRTLEPRRVQHDLAQAVQARIAANERKLALSRARRPWIAAAMVVLAGGIVVSAFYANKERHARLQAQTAAAKVQAAVVQEQHARKQADAIKTFLIQDIIGTADPFRAGTPIISLRDALDRAEKNIPARFKDDPETEGKVRIMLGQAYVGHADYAAARDQDAKAVAVIEAHPATDQALAMQARTHEAGILLNLGDLKSFDQVVAPVIKADDAGKLTDPKLRVLLNFTLGKKHLLVQDPAGAVKRLEKASALAQTVPDADPATGIRIDEVLAGAYTENGDYARAVARLTQTAAQASRVFGPRHPETINVRTVLGMALVGARRWHEAVSELTALRQDATAVMGADSEMTLNADELLATALIGAGDYKTGIPLMQSGYARRAKRSGASNPITLGSAVSLADALRLGGQPADALTLIATAQHDAATLPKDAAAPFLQKLTYEQACSVIAQGHATDAAKLAATLDAKLLNASDPGGNWPQRIDALRSGATAGAGKPDDSVCGRLVIQN